MHPLCQVAVVKIYLPDIFRGESIWAPRYLLCTSCPEPRVTRTSHQACSPGRAQAEIRPRSCRAQAETRRRPDGAQAELRRSSGRDQAELRPSSARARHADEVGEDAGGGDGRARARALHDERLRRVPLGGEGADVVGVLRAREGVRLGVLAQLDGDRTWSGLGFRLGLGLG